MLSIHFTPAPGSLDSYATFASKHKKFVDICTDTSKVQASEVFLCASAMLVQRSKPHTRQRIALPD